MPYFALTDSDWPWDDQGEGRAIVVKADTPEDAVTRATDLELNMEAFNEGLPRSSISGGVTWKISQLWEVGHAGVIWEAGVVTETDPVTYYPKGANGPLFNSYSVRQKLPARRINQNRTYTLMGVPIEVSFGLGPETLDVREVFVNTRKFGTAIDVMMRDTCVLISFLLQHGEDIKNLMEPLSCNDKGMPEGFAGLLLREIIALDVLNDQDPPDRSLIERPEE